LAESGQGEAVSINLITDYGSEAKEIRGLGEGSGNRAGDGSVSDRAPREMMPEAGASAGETQAGCMHREGLEDGGRRWCV
jgi:hypothetical protein